MLLRQAGYRFHTEPSAYDELRLDVEPACEVLAHARGKAADVAARHAGEATVVLAADTVVVHGGTLLGKPRDPTEAAAMLRALSGTTHDVLTAFTVVDCLSGRDHEGVVRTVVHFRPLADAEIARYVSTGESLDKAGGYAIQGRGAMLTAGMEGDFSNVVGLPLSAVAIALASVGVHPVA